MPRHRKRRASSGGQRMTCSRTAELLFPVNRVERLLRERYYFRHMSGSAPVFVAAVIQYLTAKVLELAGNEAQNWGGRRITPEMLDRVLHSNALFSSLFRDTTFSQVALARR